MPLIPCPDCSTRVSSIAPICPKCGRPLQKLAPHDAMPLWVKQFIIFIVIATVVGVLIYGVIRRDQQKIDSLIQVQKSVNDFKHRLGTGP